MQRLECVCENPGRKPVRTLLAILVVALAAGCSHVQLNAGSNTSSVTASPSAGTSVTSGSAGLQVQSGSRSLAIAIVIMGLAAGAAEYSREERSFSSPAALFPLYTPPAPELAPDRRVSEQDCTRPVDFFAGNLRCR
jgi:hypothetical protein